MLLDIVRMGRLKIFIRNALNRTRCRMFKFLKDEHFNLLNDKSYFT